jgi:CheY-like chemotaxis protein
MSSEQKKTLTTEPLEPAAPPATAPPSEEPAAAGETPAPIKASDEKTGAVTGETPVPIKEAAEKPAAAPVLPCEALVIDDEPANRDFLIRLLEQAKLKVRGASTAAEALQAVKEIENLTLIVIDNKLPDMDGVELLCQLRPKYPSTRMIMATMLDERALMAKAFDNGCDVFLVKPHGFMELFRRLQMPAPPGEDNLKRLIIDQYGPRPYRG